MREYSPLPALPAFQMYAPSFHQAIGPFWTVLSGVSAYGGTISLGNSGFQTGGYLTMVVECKNTFLPLSSSQPEPEYTASCAMALRIVFTAAFRHLWMWSCLWAMWWWLGSNVVRRFRRLALGFKARLLVGSNGVLYVGATPSFRPVQPAWARRYSANHIWSPLPQSDSFVSPSTCHS